jgi:hypothetical protein
MGKAIVTAQVEQRIWELHLQRQPVMDIASALNLHRNTVGKIIKKITSELSAHQHERLEVARQEAIASLDWLLRDAWTSAGKCSVDSPTRVGYLRIVLEALRHQQRLMGLELVTINHRLAALDRIDTILAEPIPIMLPGGDGNEDG